MLAVLARRFLSNVEQTIHLLRMALVSSPPGRCLTGSMLSGWAMALFMLCQGGRSGLCAETASRVDFNFQIRPLLSDRCFKCHGPDEKSRKAKLRLDNAEGAYAVRDAAKGTKAISPGRRTE